MDMYSSIFTRASTRNFNAAPLSEETLKQIEAFISNVKPLVPNVKITHQIVGAASVKGMALPKAPHYLLISGEENQLRNICAGFFYQHAELYLYSTGLAARWLGGVKGKQSGPNQFIGIAFGKPAGSAARKHDEFKRKPLGEISKGTDSRLEAARLAPSGLNSQPWYFIAENNVVHAYYKKTIGGLLGKLYNLTDLDLGIALCHLAVASEHEKKPFNFVTGRKDAPVPPQGFIYAGTVE